MRKKKSALILKSLIIIALSLSACYIAFRVPEKAMGTIPAAQTLEVEYSGYNPTVTAKGALVKQGEGYIAVVAVNEADISEVEIGQRAELSGAAFPDGEYGGLVTAISDTAYTMQSAGIPEIVVDVTVTLDSGDITKLRSGYSATALLKTGEERKVIMLPYSAIGQDSEGEFVYVLQDGAAVRRGIVTGIELSEKTEIVSGLTDRDLVLSNPESLTSGERVITKK